MTLVGDSPCSYEAGGVLKDQFVKQARSQSKQYGLHTDKEKWLFGKMRRKN